MISLAIDGNKIEVEPGRTLLEAARDNGIHIPTLCYHEALKPLGGCRMCVVFWPPTCRLLLRVIRQPPRRTRPSSAIPG